jgi:hypothetical protein
MPRPSPPTTSTRFKLKSALKRLWARPIQADHPKAPGLQPFQRPRQVSHLDEPDVFEGPCGNLGHRRSRRRRPILRNEYGFDSGAEGGPQQGTEIVGVHNLIQRQDETQRRSLGGIQNLRKIAAAIDRSARSHPLVGGRACQGSNLPRVHFPNRNPSGRGLRQNSLQAHGGAEASVDADLNYLAASGGQRLLHGVSAI